MLPVELQDSVAADGDVHVKVTCANIVSRIDFAGILILK